MEERLKKKWRSCAFEAMFITGLCASSTSVVVSILREHWDLNYSMTGTMLSMVVVGNIAASFLVGILSGWLGERGANLLLSLGSCLGYLLLVVTGNPFWLCTGFLLVGMAKGATLNTGTVLVKRATPSPTKYLNLMHACYATGGLICPFVIAAFSRGVWWAPMGAVALVGLLHFVAFFIAELPTKAAARQQKEGDWGFLRQPFFWLFTATLFCQCASEQAVTSWVVSYFKDCGILTGFYGDLTVTVVWGAMLCARLAIAFLFKFRDNFKALAVMVAGCLVSYGFLLRSKSGMVALAALFLFGLCVAGTNPTLVASGGSFMTPKALGVMMPVGSLGAVLMPYLVGAVAELGGMEAGMVCPMFSFGAMLILVLVCRRAKPAAV